MYEITLAENPVYQIPALDFRGTPTGIDLLKVVETGILPVVNTGIAHKRARHRHGRRGPGEAARSRASAQALLAFAESLEPPRRDLTREPHRRTA